MRLEMQKEIQREIANIPLFKDVDVDGLHKLLGDSDVIEFKAGNYICRAGEYSDDCSILLDGSVDVRLPQKALNRSKSIIMGKGEIFGEIAVLSGNPRTADIIALEPCRVLHISRVKLFKIIDKFSLIKDRLSEQYRQRALKSHLHMVPIFASIPDDVLDELTENITLHSYRKGEVIFEQNDEADAFYLVRYGFIKVHEKTKEGKERVLAYLKEGHYFGEMALMEEGGKRNATITSINRVELIRISKEVFRRLLDSHQKVKSKLERIVEKRKERSKQIAGDVFLESTLSASISMGVIQANALLIMDLSKCVHCNNCVKACAALHNGHSRLSRKGSKLTSFLLVPTSCRHCDDPICMTKCPTGAITRGPDGEIYHKDFCIGCGGCAKRCPYGNITIIDATENQAGFGGIFRGILAGLSIKKKEDDQEKKGRFIFPGNRNMVKRSDGEKLPGDRNMISGASNEASGGAERMLKKPSGKKAVKCDMCRDYEFMGCVYNCPTGAARRVNPSEFFSTIATIS